MKKFLLAYILFHLFCGYMAEGSWYASFSHVYRGYPELAEENRRGDAWGGTMMAAIGGPLALLVWGTQDGMFQHGIVWNWPTAPKQKDVEYAEPSAK